MGEAEEAEDVASLAAKLQAYEAQLPQIETLLTAQPEEASWIKMRDDMKSLIDVTKILLEKAKEGAQNAQTTEEKADSEGEDSSPAAPGLPFRVGEVVEVTGSDRPYAGVITRVHDPPLNGGIEVSVKYFEYEGEVGLPWRNIVKLEAGEINQNQENADWWRSWKGQGKYSADQTYYRCSIESLTEHGAMVVFTDYGNKEELPLAYLRSAPDKSSSTAASRVGQMQAIPEKLQIKDTDSEEQKRAKLKKSKSIRSHNRQVAKELEVAAVQKSWQKFVNKGAKRGMAGMASVTGKNSASSRPGAVMAGATKQGVSSMTISAQPMKRQRLNVGPSSSSKG